MTHRTEIQPRFFMLLALLCIMIAMCFKMACNVPVRPAHITAIDTVLQDDHRILDSLAAEIEMRDATIAQLQREVKEASGNVTEYVTRYRTITDTVEKLITCDSLAAAAQVLVVKCAQSDSVYQAQILTYKLTSATYEHALDTCEIMYSAVAGQLEQSNAENFELKKRNRLFLIGGSSGIALTAIIAKILQHE
jgi:hypothetical protein